MHVLFTPVGATVYLVLALLVATAGRDRRMGFWGFFWASLLLTPLVTGFFVIMAEPAETPAPRRVLKKVPRAGAPQRPVGRAAVPAPGASHSATPKPTR